MKKFIVRRDIAGIGTTNRNQWACNAARANHAIAQLSPDIVWVRSVICDDTAYCEYFAKDAETVRRHSELVGFPASAVESVCSEIQPSDAEDECTVKTRLTYEAAADYFDAPQLAFWDRAGKRTVQKLELSGGARVLDVGCGTGASAIPAGQAVGPTGSVLGIDLAEPLLELARTKAADNGLGHVRFQLNDMRHLELPNESFDAVISVFSLFFVDDMQQMMREWWRMVAPGGKMSITTWGPRVLEPAADIWWRAVADEQPELIEEFRPWETISQSDTLGNLFVDAGLSAPTLYETNDCQPLTCPEDWWPMVMGSGFRWTVDRLGREAAARVKDACLKTITSRGITSVECNTIQAVLTKPE